MIIFILINYYWDDYLAYREALKRLIFETTMIIESTIATSVIGVATRAVGTIRIATRPIGSIRIATIARDAWVAPVVHVLRILIATAIIAKAEVIFKEPSIHAA